MTVEAKLDKLVNFS